MNKYRTDSEKLRVLANFFDLLQFGSFYKSIKALIRIRLSDSIEVQKDMRAMADRLEKNGTTSNPSLQARHDDPN